MWLLRSILLCACITAVAVGAAQACPNHSSKTAQLAPTQQPASAAAVVAWKPRTWLPAAVAASRAQGLRVSIDPVDGTLSMPAPDESAALIVAGEDAPVSMIRRANGSGRAQLDERFAEFAVATLGSDGKPAWTCVQGATGAARFMKQPTIAIPASAAPTVPVWEEK